jgi:RNA polymerase sigma-70 factor (ECF subfamily)
MARLLPGDGGFLSLLVLTPGIVDPYDNNDRAVDPGGRGPEVMMPVTNELVSPQSDPNSSFQLVARAKGGDQLAIELLCSRYLKRLESWAHGRLPAWARSYLDTEDIAQETLVQVIRRLDQFEPKHEGAFQGYVFRTMINRVLDEMRKANRKPPGSPLDSQQLSESPSPFEIAVEQQLRQRYESALLRLRDSDRDAIVERIELELSWSEVMLALEKPSPAAAQMAVSRALVKLAREMSLEE